MKNHTSRIFKVFAGIYLLFPVFYLPFIVILFDIPGQQIFRILLSPLFYLLSGLAVLVGYGLMEVRRWSWYLFVITNLLIIYNNAVYVSEFGSSHHKFLAFLASTFVILAMGFQIRREIRVPYVYPRYRWWESNPLYRFSLAAGLIRKKNSESASGEILDLSIHGCFLKLKSDLDLEEEVQVKFQIFGQTMTCVGMVVWRTQSTVTLPKGVGIKFKTLPRSQRKILKVIQMRLRKIFSLYRSSRYLMSEREFKDRVENLINQPLNVFRAEKFSRFKKRREA